MLEALVNFDRNLFLAINGLHNSFWDFVMWWSADRFIWIPLYLAIAVYLYRNFGQQALIMIFFSGLLIILSDQGSVMIKNMFERLRPCQDDSLAFMVHTVNDKCGGKYGFVSSHAANTMAVFAYLLMLARNRHKWLTGITAVWVLLTGYNRVYLGVHFPADVFGGWIVGIVAAVITYVIYRLIFLSPVEFLRKK